MKRFIYYEFFLLLFIVSCNNSNKKELVSTDSKPKESYNKEIVNKSLHSDTISEVIIKIQKQEKLTKTDYTYICDFLFMNNDESKSEEAGYNLFEYLKGNRLNNDYFTSYLNEEDVIFKEKVLNNLIKIMCIDIGEENYSYEDFIKDFNLFKNSVSAKKAFDECMSNQVY